MRSALRSLNNFNFRLWSGGSLVSNLGSWMQRTAQDWLVLTGLTHNNATAMGIVMALQFAPPILLLPLTGYAADHFDRRKLLFVTQAALGTLAVGLGLLTVTGLVQLWHVYVFAFLLGCAAAFDMPARQTFVAELVGEADLPNAVALNSTSFNLARLVGPALAGILIARMGCGFVFLINAASFLAVIASLCLLRADELHVNARPGRSRGSLIDGFRYVRSRADIRTVLWMLFLIGTFGINFPIFISTMSVSAFHAGAGEYGLLSSMMAIGSVAGALAAASRTNPGIALLVAAAALFGSGFALAAVVPNYFLFGIALILIGAATQTFTTSANSAVQLATEVGMRGRVIALFLAIALGGTPLGAPIIGWIADQFGPRLSLCVGAASGFAAALVGLAYLARRRDAASAAHASIAGE